MEQRPELLDKFIAYMHTMYPFVLAAYGNPPEFVNLNTSSLKDAVAEGVPPAEIGNEWYDILRWVFLQGITWEPNTAKTDLNRVLPTPKDMQHTIEKYWNHI